VPQRIRVISWNLHGAARPRLDAVSDLLKAHEPDVVALQESRHYQARRISGLLGWPGPVWAFKHNGYWPLWWRAEGLAVMSHHPLAAHPPVLLTPGIGRRSFRRRILLPVELAFEHDRRLLLVDAHLSSEAGDQDRRAQQAEQVVAILPGSLPELVVGDLNAVPDAAAIAILLGAGFVDSWSVAGAGQGVGGGGAGGGGYTHPANAPRQRIDYVLARGIGQVVEAEVIDDLGAAMSGLSDHRPVLAVVELEASPPSVPVTDVDAGAPDR
jgi:endonuclease/exonuclease/phosphatase family metal-dependent hydrolase